MGGLPKLKVCKVANLHLGPGGLLKTAESTIGRGGLPPHSPSVPVVTKVGVPVGVASVGPSPRGLPRQNESREGGVSVGTPPWGLKGQNVSRWVELVLGLHHGDS